MPAHHFDEEDEHESHGLMGKDNELSSSAGHSDKKVFWAQLGLACALGCVTPFLGLLLLMPAESVPEWWIDKKSNANMSAFGGGEWWWIAVTTGTGVVVGILRYVLKLPDKLPSFIEDLKEQHVQVEWVLPIVLTSAVSLAGGMSLGPEAGLAQLGGGVAAFASRRLGCQPKTVSRATVLGMSGTFGALLGSPVVATMMLCELGRPGILTRMQYIMQSWAASGIGFVIFYAVAGETFLDVYEMPDYTYEPVHLAYGALLGAVSAVLAVVAMAILAMGSKTLGAFRRSGPKGQLLGPVIGGLLFGFVIKGFPLTAMAGSAQLTEVIAYEREACAAGAPDTCDTSYLPYLIATAFMKLVALSLCMAGGHVGGVLFPVFFYGGSLGLATHIMFPAIPEGLCFGAMFAAVGGGLFAAPFTLIMLISLSMGTNARNQVPIAFAMFVSYGLLHGTGILKPMAAKEEPKEERLLESHSDLEN